MSGSYEQYCALARALDVVGNRWTLLIVRELRPGPRRFTDLLEGLPGVSRKLLTERLRDLERDGVIARRELPPPAARTVYELTADGRDLAHAIAPLIAWGARRLGERRSGEFFHPRWLATAMAAFADGEAARGVHDVYQYVVGEHAFHFVVDDGAIEVHDGVADDPSLVVTSDEGTLTDIGLGRTKPSHAIGTGALTIAGDNQARKRLRRIFVGVQTLVPANERSNR